MAITRRQKEVLDFIQNFVERCGYSPSFEEIAHGLDLTSLATVHKHISNLERKGLLQRAHNRSRSIDVLPERKKSTMQDIPMLGRIAAGLPVEAIETQESLSLNDMVDNKTVFALEVRGESMRDDHIMHGDYVLIEKTQTAAPGGDCCRACRWQRNHSQALLSGGPGGSPAAGEYRDGADLRPRGTRRDSGASPGNCAEILLNLLGVQSGPVVILGRRRLWWRSSTGAA